MNIIVFGASQVHGAADLKNGGWARLLQAYVQKKSDFEDDLYNLAISGETSSEILKRFEAEIVPRLREKIGNVVLISLGGNDCIYKNRRSMSKLRVSEKQYAINIKKMISIARKHGCRVAFVGKFPIDDARTQPVSWDKEVNYWFGNLKRHDVITKEVCEKENVPFLDLWSAFEEKNYKKYLDDGIHPNALGHKKIFNEVLKFLKSHKIMR